MIRCRIVITVVTVYQKHGVASVLTVTPVGLGCSSFVYFIYHVAEA